MQRGGQLFKDIIGHEVVTRGFLRRKVMDYFVYLGSFDAVNRGSSWK
jgi:hypothetical protein